MSASPGTARRRSRQAALQVLYAAELGGGGLSEVDASFERVAHHFELPEPARAFARELVAGVAREQEHLDALVARHARHWKMSRMAAVDRNVLRLGAYELAYSETPTSVVIDEAIELARRFGDEPSPAFVNGVLDAVAWEVRPEGARRAKEREG